MNLNEVTYQDFYMERTSYLAQSKAPVKFSKEEIEWAINQTEYKYFGDYEFDDQQKIAIEVMAWACKEYIKNE